MNDARWDLSVTPSADEMYQAMVVAGQHLARGPNRIKMIAHGLFTCLFAPMGATMILWVIVKMSGGPSFTDLSAAALPITFLVFGGVAMWLSRQIFAISARAAVTSRFGRAYDLSISAEGVTQTTNHSRWHTGWEDVVRVGRGKTTLAILISGIVIAVPRNAFLGPLDADDAFATMKAWQEAAQ